MSACASESLAWIAALPGHLAHAHTEPAVAVTLFRALHATLPVESVRLGIVHADHCVGWQSHSLGSDATRVRFSHPDPMRTEKSWVFETEQLEQRTCCLVSFSVPVPMLDSLGWQIFTQVVGMALSHVQMLSRVAEVSRRAIEARSEIVLERAHEHSLQALGIHGQSMVTWVRDVVSLVARQNTTVLLTGETGTGKELIARAVHALSRRAGRTFIKVNCGAIPEGLIDSTLFGHERGAFTGAHQRHAGVFERAHGGTLLLDEIAELPSGAQARLLRVLQEGEFERVGGESPVTVDVRVIAATHRPLDTMVAAGHFRQDLFYRLSVFPLRIPPLRERQSDLPSLVQHLVGTLSLRLGRSIVPRVTDDVLVTLTRRPWPGNIRELENVLEHALILSPETHLVLPVESTAQTSPSVAATDNVYARTEQLRREAIETALRTARGRIHGAGGAAERLNVAPTTLQSRMRKLGIDRKSFTG